MEENKSKIGKTIWMLLIAIAVFFDIVKWVLLLLPVVGEILGEFVDLIAGGSFWLIFKMNDEKYSKNTLIAGFFIGLIPVVGQIIPEWTGTIIKLYFDTKVKKTLSK